MKKIITLAIATSALLAGPDIGNLIDYDAEDNYMAQIQEARQFTPTPIIAPTITKISPIATQTITKKQNCCSNRDSVDVIGGYNFTEDDGALDDAANIGIRYNKNIAPNTYVQLGYNRVLNADYKKGKKRTRSITGNYDNRGTGTNSNYTSGTTNSEGNQNPAIAATQKFAGGTQLDRFYLNGMYEFCKPKRVTPYIFGGLGYENVRHESSTLQSGGFANAGAGLKYQIGEDLNLLTEAKAIKKFDNNDLDIVAGVGIGVMFGAAAMQMVPVSEFETTQPTIVPSIISTNTPLKTIVPPIVQTHIQQVPAYNPMYEDLDVVAIDDTQERSIHQKRINQKRYLSNRKNNYKRYSNNNKNYYIQVAALFENSGTNSIYFRKLNAQGLNHQIKSTTINGQNTNLLLVGPYNSRAAANADLSRVRTIERGAFIKKLKS